MASRTDGKNVFESASGELLLDKSKNYMRINTPRLQGICAEAGTKAEMSDFFIRRMTADGNLALVAVDGLNPIFNAEHLVLVYATNALNSGMEFSSDEMVTLVENGTGPTLIKRGAFTVTIRHQNAAKLVMYSLDLAGNRIKKISPTKAIGENAEFSVDTGKDGASVFFEIIVE